MDNNDPRWIDDFVERVRKEADQSGQTRRNPKSVIGDNPKQWTPEERAFMDGLLGTKKVYDKDRFPDPGSGSHDQIEANLAAVERRTQEIEHRLRELNAMKPEDPEPSEVYPVTITMLADFGHFAEGDHVIALTDGKRAIGVRVVGDKSYAIDCSAATKGLNWEITGGWFPGFREAGVPAVISQRQRIADLEAALSDGIATAVRRAELLKACRRMISTGIYIDSAPERLVQAIDEELLKD